MATPMPTPPKQTEITIDPKHARLQAFLAGKGIRDTSKPVKISVSDTELTSLISKAKANGYEDLIKYPKAAAKKAAKAQEDADEADAPIEPRDEKPSKETTADLELEGIEDEEEESSPKRRRRSS